MNLRTLLLAAVLCLLPGLCFAADTERPDEAIYFGPILAESWFAAEHEEE